jgi:hypothetical protein
VSLLQIVARGVWVARASFRTDEHGFSFLPGLPRWPGRNRRGEVNLIQVESDFGSAELGLTKAR